MRAAGCLMQTLEVIDPGLCTTIQDSGRMGFRHVGVPASGPLDRMSFQLANAVVGNHSSTPALEILMSGPTLKVLAESIRVALVGCNASIEIGLCDVRQISTHAIIRRKCLGSTCFPPASRL